MKKLIPILLGALLAVPVFAQSLGNPAPNPALNVFTGSPNPTNVVAGNSWAVATARSGNGGAPVVNYIAAYTTNVLLGQLIFYKVTAQVPVTFTNSTVTLFVRETNGFGSAQSDIVVIRHLLDDSYDRRVLTANSDTTNLVLTIAPNTTVPGDIVYRVTTNSVLPWNNTNGPASSVSGIYVGQAQKPLLIDFVGGGALQTFSFFSGRFEPPVLVPRPGL